MAAPADNPSVTETFRLLNENEQLKIELESSLDENTLLIEDRDRLLRRVAALARELQSTTSLQRTPSADRADEEIDTAQAETKLSQTEEELRVAFEELQVLTEELEVANNGLQRANEELEERVRSRTRELTAANSDLRQSELRMGSLIDGIPQLV